MATAWVGKLPTNITAREVGELFARFGPVRSVSVRPSSMRTDAFALVEFDYARDCREAITGMDGRHLDGQRLRVDLASGDAERSGGGRDRDRYEDRRPRDEHDDRGRGDRDYERGGRYGGGGGGDRYDDRDRGRGGGYDDRDRRGGGGGGDFDLRSTRPAPPNRLDFTIRISGVPSGAIWKDVREFLKPHGEAGFASKIETDRGVSSCVVEVPSAKAAEDFVHKLDNTEFVARNGSRGMVRVEVGASQVSASALAAAGAGSGSGSSSQLPQPSRAPGSSKARSDFRVKVSGLTEAKGAWLDAKKAIEGAIAVRPGYSEKAVPDGRGGASCVVDVASQAEVDEAVRRLDGSALTMSDGVRVTLKVEPFVLTGAGAGGAGGGAGSGAGSGAGGGDGHDARSRSRDRGERDGARDGREHEAEAAQPSASATSETA